MHRAFTSSDQSWHLASPVTEKRVLALDITDMGFNDGIDVAIHGKATGDIIFETVLSDPDCRRLLTAGSPETEVFWQSLQPRHCLERVPHLLLTARCCFSLFPSVVFIKRLARADVRNAAFLRLIEDMLDELQTRVPGMAVEVAVTHRNPLFADFIGY